LRQEFKLILSLARDADADLLKADTFVRDHWHQKLGLSPSSCFSIEQATELLPKLDFVAEVCCSTSALGPTQGNLKKQGWKRDQLKVTIFVAT